MLDGGLRRSRRYMRKYGFKLDYDNFEYSVTEHITYLTTKYLTVPTYRLFGGRKNRTNALNAAEVVSIGAHFLMTSPVGLCALVWGIHQKRKHQNK